MLLIGDGRKMSKMTGITIEEISPGNVSGITELIIKLWPECDYKEEYENGLKIMKSADQQIFVAKEKKSCIGFIQLSLKTDYVEGTTSSPVVYIEGLYVEPQCRRKGIARRLILKAEKWGLRKNCVEIASDSELTNTDSIEFHNSIGFQEVNRIVCFKKLID
jgi:aminoglycoside 6'-N-acetyltransferase I